MPLTRSQRARKGIAEADKTPPGISAEGLHNELRPNRVPTSSSCQSSRCWKMPVKRRVTFSPSTEPAGKRFRVASGRYTEERNRVSEPTVPLTPMRSALAAGLQKLMNGWTSTQERTTGHAQALDMTIDSDHDEPDSAIADMYGRTPDTPGTPSRLRGLSIPCRRRVAEDYGLETFSSTAATSKVSECLRIRQDDQLDSLQRLWENLQSLRQMITSFTTEDLLSGHSFADVRSLCADVLKMLDHQFDLSILHGDDKTELIDKLHQQIDDLLKRLAQSEARCEQIQTQRQKLASERDQGALELDGLRKEAANIEHLQQQLLERDEQLATLEVEKDEAHRSSQRLKQSLEGYRKEEERLQGLIVKMEQTHARAIRRISAKHATTVQHSTDRDPMPGTEKSQSSSAPALLTKATTARCEPHSLQCALAPECTQTERQPETSATQPDARIVQQHTRRIAQLEQTIVSLRHQLDDDVDERRQVILAVEEQRTIIESLQADLEDANAHLSSVQKERDSASGLLVETKARSQARIADVEADLFHSRQQHAHDMQEAAEAQAELERSIVLLQASVLEQTRHLTSLVHETRTPAHKHDDPDLAQKCKHDMPGFERAALKASPRDVEWFSLMKRQTDNLKALARRSDWQDSTITSLKQRNRVLLASVEEIFRNVDSSLELIASPGCDVNSAVKQQRQQLNDTRVSINARLSDAAEVVDESDEGT